MVPAPADNGCHDDVECASKVCFQCSPDATDCPDGFECALEPAAGVPVCVREGADVTSAVSLGGACASAATCDDFGAPLFDTWVQRQNVYADVDVNVN